MCMKLPISDFKWLEGEEFKKFDLKNIDPDGEFGYILKVDISYLEELHDAHDEFPFFPTKS
jgi:hypothetical protein